MNRRDLFKFATGGVAAFLVAKYGPPKPKPETPVGQWYYIPSPKGHTGTAIAVRNEARVVQEVLLQWGVAR